MLAGVLLSGALVANADPLIQTVGTHTMTLRDDVTPPIYLTGRKFSFNVRSALAPVENQVNAPLPGSDGDPTAAGATGGGGVLEVYNTAGSGERLTVPLPVAQWRRDGDPAGEFRYVFASTPPVWKVFVKRHKISIRGGKEAWGYTLEEPSQGRIGVRLTLGTGITWCTEAEPKQAGLPPSPAKFDKPGRFAAAKLQNAPATCPPLP
jgi:hypothetical protein